MNVPLFTIITATYNAGSVLPRLLASLASQTFRDFVLVVQDGASSDNTLVVIDAWRDRLPGVSVESVPDKGVYNAWNKALDRTGGGLGQWVLFLGADDTLAGADVLEKVRCYTQLPSPPLFWSGSMNIIDTDGRLKLRVKPRISSDRQDMRVAMARHLPFGHGALFHNKSLFSGQRFDNNFVVCGDYEFIFRMLSGNDAIRQLPLLVTLMYHGGISSKPEQILNIRLEELEIARRYAPKGYVWDFWRVKALAKAIIQHVAIRFLGITLSH